MIRKIAMVLLALLLMTGCASAANNRINNMMVSNCDSWVSLRSAADTDSSRIMKVSRGEYVYAEKAVGDFWYCEYNGRKGYILGAYLCVVDGAQFSGGREMVVANCDEWVSLRSTADASSPRLRQVSLGETVTAYDRVGDFTLCNHRGKWGYILTKYLKNKSGGGAQNNQVSSGVMYVANCEEWVSLRSSASTSASRLAKVPLGAQVETLGRSGQFTKCRYNGKTGYILSKYLSSTKPGLSAPVATIAPAATAQLKYLGPMYVANCDQIALRKNADMLSEVVTYIPLGGRVEAYEYNAMFYQCWYNSMMVGYIPKNYLSMTPPATFAPATLAPLVTPAPSGTPLPTLAPLVIPVIGGTPTPEPTEEPSVYIGTRYVSVNAKTVAMYESPDLSAPVLAEIAKGTALEVYSGNDLFVKVTFEGAEGYIVASALDEEPPEENWFVRFLAWLRELFSF